MHISPKALYDILSEKGITSLHHANSVVTSCSFLRSAQLISRGTLERDNGIQTSQYSDSDDKRYDVWFDVFTDSVDIHKRAKRINNYGPVLFDIDLKILKSKNTGKVWVSKLNPTKWAGKSYSERWFTGKDDVKEHFLRGRFDQMIIFRHCGGALDIKNHINKIILDDPFINLSDEKVDLYSTAYGALKMAMTEGKIDAPIIKRSCHSECTCREYYDSNFHDFTMKMFFPEI
ncbi:hypothetical protein [Halobacteriovorax sp. HLS]|uniref:hypothetical protein n=1 Tax=Halobacteriovorax sp. HLS TaxID=2234000 RepID=UPI000FD74756|nr:hypothetical protein [Halobacteriovorax sp. HLS]